MLLTREAVLSAKDVATEDVEVPAWGGKIRVRSMTVAEQNEFARRASSQEKTSVGAWLVAALAVDENGGQLFTTEDVAALEKKNAKAVAAVVEAILKVNKIGEKEVNDAEKN